jgi:transposase
MVQRKLTIPERWQAVGMHNGGFSHRRVADHFRVNHSIIVRLMQRLRQTGNVTDRPRAGRSRLTTLREDRLISRRTRQRPFSTDGALRGNLAFGGHISTCTVIRHLHHQGMRARRPIKRPQLTLRHRHAQFDWSRRPIKRPQLTFRHRHARFDWSRRLIKHSQLTLRHRHARFDWSHDHLEWTIRTWRRVHWSDESRFLLRPTDGRARVWRQRNTSFQNNHILDTTAFGVEV